MELALSVTKNVDQEFREIFGRGYDPVEEYSCEDAELILVTSGALASSAKEAVDLLRDQGMKVGVFRIRTFRPFPKKEVVKTLRNVKKVAVIDRNISFGQGGIFSSELQAALFQERVQVPVFSFIAGLGGKDVTMAEFEKIVDTALATDNPEKYPYWIGVLP